MTIQQMQYALEIYRSKSISQAAARLFMSQSNLSTILLRMEKELGFPIFTRSSKGIYPTESGEQFLHYAGAICANYDDMLSNLRTGSHRVRIGGAQYTPLKDAFSKLALAYETAPHANFSYNIFSRQEALEKLSTASLDLVVLLVNPDQISAIRKAAKEMSLALTLRQTIPMVLRIGPNHPLYNEPEIPLSAFWDYTFVDYPMGSFLQNEQISALLKINPNRIIKVHDAQLRNQIVSGGSMYSIGSKLPEHINEQYRFRSIPLGNLSHQIVSLTQKGRTLPTEAAQYLRLLDEELSAI